jgi:hypothetical protein
MNKLTALAVAAAAAFASSPPAAASEVAGAFSRGRTSVIVSGGVGYAFNESYLILGVGASYYVVDGLNVGLSVESWSQASPGLLKVTPSVQYVFHKVPLNPYIGAFYRRTYIDNLPDLDSVGARAGFYFSAGRNAYLGVGAVYESYLDCTETRYHSCNDTYPEISFVISF